MVCASCQGSPRIDPAKQAKSPRKIPPLLLSMVSIDSLKAKIAASYPDATEIVRDPPVDPADRSANVRHLR